MKNLLSTLALGLFVISLFISRSAHAQAPIPNGDFERWTGNNPDGWFVDNVGVDMPILKTIDAHSGKAAFYGAVVDMSTGGKESPIAIAGGSPLNWGFPYVDRPTSFTGYYRFNGMPGDKIVIDAVFKKNGQSFGSAELVASVSTTNQYSKFFLPIKWQLEQTPDSAYINLTIFGYDNSTYTAQIGSVIYVDDLAFTNATQGVAAPNAFALQQSQPNPVSGTASIEFTLQTPGDASLTLYNVAGQVRATPFQQHASAGAHVASIDVAPLPTGSYWYRLSAGGKSQVRSMQVMH